MPIAGLPEFEDGEILPAGKLNQLVQAVQSKFSAITADDFVWPLVAQGDIDMAGLHSIVGLAQFWNITNAAEYATIQAAVDAVEGDGGGVVFIPPDANAIVEDGITIEASNIMVVGGGRGSSVQLTTSATSGYLFRAGTTGLSGISFMNLRLIGDPASTNQACIIARNVTGLKILNVEISAFSGPFIQVTNDGTPGAACEDIQIDVRCDDGASSNAKHFLADDVDGADIKVISNTCATDAIVIEPAAAAGKAKNIHLHDCRVVTAIGDGIQMLGASATPNANWSRNVIEACQVDGCTGYGYRIGDILKALQYTIFQDCQAHNPGDTAFLVNIHNGKMADCHGWSTAQNGIDLHESTDLTVVDCIVPGAGAIGIDAADTTDCYLYRNNVTGHTEPIEKVGATTLRSAGNIGVIGIGKAHYDDTGWSGSGVVLTYTVPGNTLVRKGDGIRIRASGDASGSANQSTVTAQLDANGMGQAFTRGPSTEAEWVLDTTIVLDGAGNVGYMCQGMARDEVTYNTPVAAKNIAIDMSVDVNITISLTPGSGVTVSMDQIVIEFFEGE